MIIQNVNTNKTHRHKNLRKIKKGKKNSIVLNYMYNDSSDHWVHVSYV